MATIAQNEFTSFSLTEEEERSGKTFHSLQKMVLMNHKASIATSRLNLEPDPNNYSEYIQQESFLKGQMAAIQYLLDLSEAAEAAALPPEQH
jgi:hypothetical protein